jgi:hypothetical protein
MMAKAATTENLETPPNLSPDLAAQLLKEYTEEILALRDVWQIKRQKLWKGGDSRTKWEKGLHIASGIIALFSGSAITSVVTALTSSLSVKILAAALAFLSGIISLFTTILFTEKETQQMFDGAAQYAAFRDRAQSLYDRRHEMSVHQLGQAIDRLRTDSNKLTTDFDRLLPDLHASVPDSSITPHSPDGPGRLLMGGPR